MVADVAEVAEVVVEAADVPELARADVVQSEIVKTAEETSHPIRSRRCLVELI